MHPSNPAARKGGLSFARVFTDGQLGSPYNYVEWEERDIRVKDWKTGETIFSQDKFRVPSSWSQNAGQIVASKYAFGPEGERELGVDEVIYRVVDAISSSGTEQGYFSTINDYSAFRRELSHILLNQIAAFNSPVWFNVGIYQYHGLNGTGRVFHWDTEHLGYGAVRETTQSYRYPQTSACFIQSVADTMESIMELAVSEAMLFKHGSGTGTDLSTIRSKREKLSTGGTPSGPLSFMKVYDRIASVIKSGGKTRRAAKMQTLACWHPDILDFIHAKGNEERKAHLLIQGGMDSSFNGEAYDTVSFQNANFSVRFTNEFMASLGDIKLQPWKLKAVTTGDVLERINPRVIWDAMAKETHRCGDPGAQFTDTINNWHTCPKDKTGSFDTPINSSNPCCFPYGTLVETSEGRIAIGKLNDMRASGEELPLAYGFDTESGQPVLRKIINASCSGMTQQLVEVTTDKGLSFRCTPEHEFLLRNGKYVEAKNLQPGNRLRKIARAINPKRSNRRYINRKTDTIWENRFVYEQVYGSITEGMEVHHKNEDPTDDRASNLELIPISDHDKLHSVGSANVRFIHCPEHVLVETWEAIEAKREGWPVSYSRWNKYIRDNNLDGIVPLANSAKGIRGLSWTQFAEWIEEQRSTVNDKVLSVELIPVQGGTYVYDIEVEGIHNFAITTKDSVHSVVVHNSEYLFIDDSACNLASIRLTKFWRDGVFQLDEFKQAIKIMVVAQEILVDMGSYPTRKIAQNQHDFRTIGLGFADLGGLLMRMGLAYDSEEGRAVAGCLAAIITGHGYHVSAEMASQFGPFEGYAANKDAMLFVIRAHRKAVIDLRYSIAYREAHEWVRYLGEEAIECWNRALDSGLNHGYRNAQISVVAPTGTISFMMDCDTTGIEPALGLVTYKTLAGGGNMTIVNAAVDKAIDVLFPILGVYAVKVKDYIAEHGYADGCLLLTPEQVAVFDCALAPHGSNRTISYMGHLEMMAAVQPFISGAISKTVNVPNSTTAEKIGEIYYKAWELGLKCVAIYRDGSKSSQPVTVDKPKDRSIEVVVLDDFMRILVAGAAFPDDGPVCISCSSPILVAAGTCSVCPNCGTPQGGCS